MQKNIFVVISKFSQLSLEDCEKDPQMAFNHLKVIKNLSDNTVENLAKNLNYLKAAVTAKECISIYKIINDALAKTNLPQQITIDKIYPPVILECYINFESITECFVNLLLNAIEAIETSQKDRGK